MEVLKELNAKQIWQLQLQAVEIGKEVVKEKRKRIPTGIQYLKTAEIKAKKNKQKIVKAKKKHALKSLRNGEVPATQKQIDYIEFLKKKFKKKYDYYYPRDCYGLSQKVATAFIVAIEKQTDFTFNRHVNEKKRMIKAYYDNKKLDNDLDVTLGLNSD